MVNIRRAVLEDCPRLMELIKELAVYEKEPEAVTVSQAHFEAAGFGEQPVWQSVVAEVNHQIQGFALWYTRYSTWKGSRLYLEDIIVTQSFRGSGIGKKLFLAVMDEAKRAGCTGLMWQVLDWNEPAINFYKKFPGVRFDKGWLNGHIDF